jgi:uncharacterized protein (DUF2141 family)
MQPISSLPRFAKLLIAAVPLFVLSAAQGSSGLLHVTVGNVRDHTGRVHIDLCTQAQYLKDCPITGEAPAHLGETTVTLSGLKPGHYAAQVFYDQNGNNRLDRALFGVPKEGVGFSNDAKIKLAAPKWEEAMFDYDGQEKTIRLKLRYFMGPGSASQ